MKKVSIAVMVLVFGLMGSVYAASGPTKYVEVAGSGGLNVAAKECALFLGQASWQACVAHHDGLYTPSADGTISRNYARSESAPIPNVGGPVACVAELVVMPNGDIGWVFSKNPTCK